MRRFDLGDPVPLRYVATDPDTGAAVPISGTFTLTKPGGTTYAGVTTSGGTGILDVVIPAAEAAVAGRYGYEWNISGGLNDVEVGYFYLAAAADDEVPPLASFGMLARKLGALPEDFDEAERNRGEYLLDEASELIRQVAGKTWLTTANALDAVPRRVSRICVAAAARDQAGGDLHGGAGGPAVAGREGGEVVYLTDQEEEDVRKSAGYSSFAAVTMTSPYSADAAADTWDLVTAE